MIVMGIETSCDETGIALYDAKKGLLVDKTYSQVKLHAKYGGVVPELASRDHIRKILPLIREATQETGLSLTDINGIAYTSGPGLVGALLVGAAVGRSLAWTLGIPAIAIHHLEAHILAPLMEPEPPEFPFLALLVSGGHTILLKALSMGDYQILGETLDDAAGEAFDKTASLLDLGYPGGPALARLAEQGDPGRFRFPRPMTDRPGLDFSFSGLKTFALYTHRNNQNDEQTRADIARAFQDAVVDTFVIKCRRALKETGYKKLIVAGGVSANSELRKRLIALGKNEDANVYFPRIEYCTDNGAMIAYTGYLRLQHQLTHGLQNNAKEDMSFNAIPRWPIADLGQVVET